MNNPISEPSGILLVNKAAGCTSHDVVNAVRRLYGTKRVGHAGTLDPMATGVLVVLVGRAAKASEYAVGGKKRYRAVLRLGIETDTEDITGTVIKEAPVTSTPSQITSIAGQFSGEIMQIPPMYSALKRGGKKLCDIARAGEIIERDPRPVTIYSLDIKHICDNDYSLDVICSAGTYIRTLCADIGRAAGCGGTMAQLCRTSAVGFGIEDTMTLEQIEETPVEKRVSLLLPVAELFPDLDAVFLPAFFEKLFRSGCEIYLKKLGIDPFRFPIGATVQVCDSNGNFFALGKISEYPGGIAVKSVKLFK
ncbi:MAG: tRNA pseudouridine(55) synthase TruB [Clostridia bacterium]|nr:tRNA pseudouridine(55) synthase TruB [Clostridia bacterium]